MVIACIMQHLQTHKRQMSGPTVHAYRVAGLCIHLNRSKLKNRVIYVIVQVYLKIGSYLGHISCLLNFYANNQ